MCCPSLRTATEPKWFQIHLWNGLRLTVTEQNLSLPNLIIALNNLPWEGQVTQCVDRGGIFCHTNILGPQFDSWRYSSIFEKSMYTTFGSEQALQVFQQSEGNA
jgi:hypothetical protein